LALVRTSGQNKSADFSQIRRCSRTFIFRVANRATEVEFRELKKATLFSQASDGSTAPPAVVPPSSGAGSGLSEIFGYNQACSHRPVSGTEAYNQLLIVSHWNTAKQLGNLERLNKAEKTEFFPTARQKWLSAAELLAEKHGLGSFLHIRAGNQERMDDFRAFFLNSMRIGDPSSALRSGAATIYAAATDGDVEFFRQICVALRSHDQRRPKHSPIEWCILRHWFSGLLWLMDDEAGSRALSSYMKTTGGARPITYDSYKQARNRELKLKGYQAFTSRSPVLAYLPKQRTYRYRSRDWETKLEPNPSR
jgi:hypothetical protein